MIADRDTPERRCWYRPCPTWAKEATTDSIVQGTAQTSVGGARFHVGRNNRFGCFQHAPPSPRQGVKGRLVGGVQRHHDVGPGFQKQRHLRQSVANADGFDVGPRRQIALVGHQCQRLVARQQERLVLDLLPDGRMDAVGVAAARRQRIHDQEVDAAFEQFARFLNQSKNACRLACSQGRRLPARPPSGPRLRAARQSNSSCGDRTPHRSPR